MRTVLASESGFGAAFVFVIVVGMSVNALIPLSAVVTWLKGKRATAVMLVATLISIGTVWLNNDRWFLIETTMILSFPIALIGLIAAGRLAKPGSWWFGRYKPEKQEKAIGAYSYAGRRRHRLTALAATFSAIVALAAGVFVVNAIEDLVTTSWDEVYTGVTIFVDAARPEELDRIASRAETVGASVHVESRWMDVGDAITGPLGDCLLFETADHVWVEVSPPTDEAVNDLFRALAPVPGLLAVQSELGDAEAELGVANLGVGDDEVFIEGCGYEEVVARVDPADGERSLRALADQFEGRPGVLAVGVQTWRHEHLAYVGYPDLVECFGPRELHLLIEQGADPSPYVTELQASPLVDEAFSQEELFEQETEGPSEDTSTICDEHNVSVIIEAGISNAEAASLLAAARRLPGVAHAHLVMPFSGSVECPDCIEDGRLEIVRGSLDLATMAAIEDAVCGEPGVLGISGSPDEDPPCPALSMEARIQAGDSRAVEEVTELTAASPVVYRTSVLEPQDESELPLTVIGTRNPHLCDVEGERYWRIHIEFRPADPMTVENLVGEISDIDHVVAVSGNAVDIDREDHELCGYQVLSLWLGDVTEEQKEAVIALLETQDVWAADLRYEDSHVGTDSGDTADTKWTGTVYLDSWDAAKVDSLNDMLRDTPGVVHTEVGSSDQGFRP